MRSIKIANCSDDQDVVSRSTVDPDKGPGEDCGDGAKMPQ